MSYSQSDNYQRFLDFYGNNKVSSCHGKGKLGDTYVCPHPSIGGTYTGQKALVAPSDCGAGNNIGRWAQCPAPQTGGCGGMIYSATGVLSEKPKCQNGGNAGGVPGFFADLPSGAIGNQAIYGSGDSNTVPNLLSAKGKRNFVKRTFNCAQPTWNKSCM